MIIANVLTKENNFDFRDVEEISIGIDGLMVKVKDGFKQTFPMPNVIHFYLTEITE